MSNDNDKDQEYQKNMGKRLRKIRKENALSQDDVADALGICTKQYQSINTQWMLNRINYVLVIKMESAIIEENGDKIRNIEGNGDILGNIEGKRCQNFMWRQTGNPIIINNKDRKRGQHHEKDS